MTWPPNDSPFWPIARVLSVAAALGLLIGVGSEHIDAGEVRTYIGTVVTHALVEYRSVKH